MRSIIAVLFAVLLAVFAIGTHATDSVPQPTNNGGLLGVVGDLLGAVGNLLDNLLNGVLGPRSFLGHFLGLRLADLVSSLGIDLSTLVANVEETVDGLVLKVEVAVAGDNPTLDQLFTSLNRVVGRLEKPVVNDIVAAVTGYTVPLDFPNGFLNVHQAATGQTGLLGGLLGRRQVPVNNGGLLGAVGNLLNNLLGGLLGGVLGPHGFLVNFLGLRLAELVSVLGLDISNLVGHLEEGVDCLLLKLEIAIAGDNPALDQLLSSINGVVGHLEKPVVNDIVAGLTGWSVPLTFPPNFFNVHNAAQGQTGLLGRRAENNKPLASSN